MTEHHNLQAAYDASEQCSTTTPLIVDLDGTLLDSQLDFSAMRREMELPADVPILEALAHLPPEHRETFLLYHVQGLSVPEVAAILDVPAGTVKSRLFSARQRLREYLRDSLPAPFRPRPEASLKIESRRLPGGEVSP